MGHIHTVTDADNHFKIDPITRKINPETPEKNELVQYDHNSERYTFEIPRLVDGHDMSLCDVVEIHFINISADSMHTNADIYIVDDLGSMKDVEDTVAFTWLVSSKATQLVGTLNFAIRFKCTTGDALDYVWNTKIHSGILVSNGISNTELFVEEYSDVLEKWRTRLFGIGDTEEQKIKDCSNEQKLVIANTGNDVKKDISNHANDIKEDISNHANDQKNSIGDKGTEVLNTIKLETGLTIVDGKLCAVYESGT